MQKYTLQTAIGAARTLIQFGWTRSQTRHGHSATPDALEVEPPLQDRSAVRRRGRRRGRDRLEHGAPRDPATNVVSLSRRGREPDPGPYGNNVGALKVTVDVAAA
jgi:hypothetical protein